MQYCKLLVTVKTQKGKSDVIKNKNFNIYLFVETARMGRDKSKSIKKRIINDNIIILKRWI